MLPSPGLCILIVVWILWLLPYSLRRRGGGQEPTVTAPRARWGMLIQGIAFAIVWIPMASSAAPSSVRIAITIAMAAVAIFTGFSATAALGRQWRFDAALNSDHHLIQSGPFAVVRHPIYASMLLMLIATALIVSNWIAFCLALLFYFVGTEIRVRAEESLLIARFGKEYEEYRRRVSAYLPGLR